MAELILALMVSLGFPQVAALSQAAAVQAPAQPQPVPQPPAAAPATAKTSYVVGPLDVLKITVVDETGLSGQFKVDSDGTITFPLLGRVLVGGLTVREIEQDLEKKLRGGYVNRPQVLVEVNDFRSRSIFILGEVKMPGKYPLQGEMTLLEMLALAGSLNTNASTELLVLRHREGATGSAAMPGDESNVVARVNLDDMKVGKLVGNQILQDGDTVYVPQAERFYVSGQIRSPGSFPLTRGMTVQQAIAVAGGLTERGSNRGIKIRRTIGPNETKEIDVKLTDKVLANDTIIIRQRFI